MALCVAFVAFAGTEAQGQPNCRSVTKVVPTGGSHNIHLAGGDGSVEASRTAAGGTKIITVRVCDGDSGGQPQFSPYELAVANYKRWCENASPDEVRPVGCPALAMMLFTGSDPAAPAVDPRPALNMLASVRAELLLAKPAIHIGPDPASNEWNMAVVGHPLWLWTDTPASLTSTSTSDGLTMTLNARRSNITYTMGDGASVSCAAATPYTVGVRPGTPSPNCGYTYQAASRPRGDYTVTARATWVVDWSSAPYSGQVGVTTHATRSVPVGELQAVVVSR